MINKIILILVLATLVSSYTPRKICKTITYKKRVSVIRKYKVAYNKHTLVTRHKHVFRSICKRKRVQETVIVPKITYANKRVYKTMLKRKPVKVSEPYLVRKTVFERKLVRVNYHKFIRVPTLVKVKRTRKMSRRVKVNDQCNRTVLKVKKIYARRPYVSQCYGKGKKRYRCIRYRKVSYIRKVPYSVPYTCKKVKCKVLKRSYYGLKVVYKKKRVVAYKYKSKKVKTTKLVVRHRRKVVFKPYVRRYRTTVRVKRVTYVKKKVQRVHYGYVKVRRRISYQKVTCKKRYETRYKVVKALKKFKKRVCKVVKMKKCVVWGDPHYEVAYGKNYTSRSIVGDVLIAKTNTFEIHGRVKQWQLDATVVSSVGFKIKGCKQKFFIRGNDVYVNQHDVSLREFNRYLSKCFSTVSRKIKEKYITQYSFRIGKREKLKILVGDVKGEEEWEEFTDRELRKREEQGLTKFWMEVAIVGFIRKQGACAGKEVQGRGIFYETHKQKKLKVKVFRKKCAVGHYKKALRHCKEKFTSPFSIKSCVFDQCHKMSMLAEIAFKKSVEKLKYVSRIYNARKNKNFRLLRKLLRKRNALRRKLLGNKHVSVSKKHWKNDTPRKRKVTRRNYRDGGDDGYDGDDGDDGYDE